MLPSNNFSAVRLFLRKSSEAHGSP